MNYEKLVPSRELCEEMARLGICQDEPELWWKYGGMASDNQRWEVMIRTVSHRNYQTKAFIAPTLSRMMEELKTLCKGDLDIGLCGVSDEEWYVVYDKFSDGDIRGSSEDKHLPNAVAKALIALKKS